MKMFSLLIICLCIYGVTGTPSILYSKPTINVEERQTSARPEVEFVGEKSSDSKLELPMQKLPGTNNNAEKIQVYPAYLPGTENLAEKAIPELVIRQMEHPSLDKSQ